MKKIKTLIKSLHCDNGCIDLKVSLLQNGSESIPHCAEYTIIAETNDELSFVRVGSDVKFAHSLLNLFFDNDVMPRTVDDIMRDIVFEKCMDLI